MPKTQPSLLLNKGTRRQIERFIERPSQGLLITGAQGSGKTSVVDWIAAELLDVDPEHLETYPYLLRLTPLEKSSSISIDSVRGVDRFLGRSVPGASKGSISRLIIVDDAENLGLEAQNALLKNLEEPPEGSAFIMSSSNPNQLLPTIKSRLSVIRLAGSSKAELKDYLTLLSVSDKLADQAITMSGGVPGLAIALAKNQDDHSLLTAAKLTREILSAKLYERLLLVNSLSKDASIVQDILFLLQQMARVSLETAENEQSKRWQSVLSSAHTAQKHLENKANLRLTLTYLMLHL